MERLTKYDKVRRVYVIRPDAKQGEHIQRLGFFEDKWEEKPADDYECPECESYVSEGDNFCRNCGQRITWGDD